MNREEKGIVKEVMKEDEKDKEVVKEDIEGEKELGKEKEEKESANEGKVSQKEEEAKESGKDQVPEQSQQSPSKLKGPKEMMGIMTSKEEELFNLLNDYRKQNNLAAISYSPSLTKVAQMHAKDIVENSPDLGGGNVHSWSDKGPWRAVKYTDDHKQAALMWSKPSELTDYKEPGFEISHAYVGNARKTTETKPKAALEGWKRSSGHNDVIIEKSIWKGKNFQALGIGIYKGYACCWFGKSKDNSKLETEVKPSVKEENSTQIQEVDEQLELEKQEN